jgi:hypothetical protein
MPKFTITETVPCVQIWTYEVEAANEEEAELMVINGKVEATNTIVDEYDYDETQYDIEDSE